MRALILLCLTLMVVSPAHAELRDARARLSGSEGLIWLAFDGQPQMLRSEVTDTGLELLVEGVSVSTHAITPRDRQLVTMMQVEPTLTGARIRLQGPAPWSTAGAELRQGGILVRVRLSGDTPPAPPSASHYPAPDPDWTPTPVPASVPAPDSAPNMTPASAPASAPIEADAEPAARTVPTASGESPARASTVPGRAASMAAAAVPVDARACAAAAAAVEANPWDDAGLMRHASCLAQSGEAAQASRIYEQMLAFEPSNVTALLALADLRLQQGERAAARSLYLRAAEHANSDSQALRARSQAEALRPQ